jgi:8-oxo-dGTP pyrophosphatase MutT (NUDIX family)
MVIPKMAGRNSGAAMSYADMPNVSMPGPSLSPIPRQWTPRAATAAIIVFDGRDYLLQLRDMRSDIWYPGHWGLFGGQNLPGETPEASIRRELVEELGFEPQKLCVFAEMAFGFSFATGQLTHSGGIRSAPGQKRIPRPQASRRSCDADLSRV